MSGVHATQTPTDEPLGLEAYLDTLYEIVATGVEPPEGVSLARIEGFLHEHARAAKGATDFVAFFQATGLQVRPAGEMRAPLRVLDPLPAVEPPPAAFAEPALPEPELELDGAAEDATNPAIAVPRPIGGASPVLVAVVGLLLLGLGATMAWGYLTLSQLRNDLARAQAQAADNRIAIEELDAQATAIHQEVGETHTVLRRFERKHDILLDSLLPTPVERP